MTSLRTRTQSHWLCPLCPTILAHFLRMMTNYTTWQLLFFGQGTLLWN